MQRSYTRTKYTNGSRTPPNPKMTRNIIIVVVIAASLTTVLIIGLNWGAITAASQTGQNPFAPPPPETRVNYINETSTVKPFTVSGPLYSSPVVTVTKSVYIPTVVSGSCTAYTLKSEAEIAPYLGLSSASEMYMKNGSSKVFWGYGTVTNNGGYYVIRIVFRENSAWYMGGFIAISTELDTAMEKGEIIAEWWAATYSD